MKRLLHMWILTCFTLQCFAADFEMAENRTGVVQTAANGTMSMQLLVPKGTRGKVSQIIRYQAQNNRTGEYSYGLALTIDSIPAGSNTELKPGQTINIYYSAEADQRVIKITDDAGQPIQDVTKAKYGIALKDIVTEQPIQPATAQANAVKPCSDVFDKQNTSIIAQSMKCLSEMKVNPGARIPNPELAGINLAAPVKAPEKEPVVAKAVSEVPQVNDVATGEILTYMNNVVWDAIQHEKSFDAQHFKDKAVREAKRLAEFERRKKINMQVAPVLMKNAKRRKLSPTFLTAIMGTESKFDPDAHSGAGAFGLMQVILKTARAYAKNPNLTKVELKNIALNVAIGTDYLADLVEKNDGDLKATSYSYNCGSKCYNDWVAGRRKLPNQSKEYWEKVSKTTRELNQKIGISEGTKSVLASNASSLYTE